MTKEDIIKLAIDNTIHGLKFDEDGLLRFAKLVAQHERDRMCEQCKWGNHENTTHNETN